MQSKETAASWSEIPGQISMRLTIDGLFTRNSSKVFSSIVGTVTSCSTE